MMLINVARENNKKDKAWMLVEWLPGFVRSQDYEKL